MTLEQLRIFVAVATREHVTKASRDLGLTQSATSAAIAALEARHAAKLFDRVGRSVALTEAGRLFLPEAQAVLARAAAAEAVLADLAGLTRGTLRLAASQTVANYWLPPHLTRFAALYPGVAVSLAIGNTDSTARLVREGAADLGVVEGEVADPTLLTRPLAPDEMVLVVGPAHPWASAPRTTPVALRDTPWVLREPGSGTGAVLDQLVARKGLTRADLRIALELSSNEAVVAAVEAGAGAAVLSALVARRALALGTLAAVPCPLPARRFRLLRHRERHATRAAAAFADLLGSGPPEPGDADAA